MKNESHIPNIIKHNSNPLPPGCLKDNYYSDDWIARNSQDSYLIIEGSFNQNLNSKNLENQFPNKSNEMEENENTDYVLPSLQLDTQIESNQFNTDNTQKSDMETNNLMVVYTTTPEVNLFYSEFCGKTFNSYEEYKQHISDNCIQCNNSVVPTSNNMIIINTASEYQQEKKKDEECVSNENQILTENSSDKNDNDKEGNKDPKIYQEGNGKSNLSSDNLMVVYMPSSEVSVLYCQICEKTFNNNEEFKIHFKNNCLNSLTCETKLSDNNEELETQSKEGTQDSTLPDDKKTKKDLSPKSLPKEKKQAVSEATTGKKKNSKRKNWEPKICTECGKVYRTNYKLNEHMRKHTGEKPYKCSMCVKAFRSKIGLNQHEAKHTGQYELTCNTCGKGFQCKSYLIVHQRVHSDLKPYPCTICGRDFKTKQSLLDHMNRHLGVKPYLCEICGRRFITKGLCKSHQKVHSGTDNKQYPCSVCNKMFVSKSYLTTHMRIHTGEKPFMCEVCGKGFLTRVDLRIHFTMHSGEKSFVCEWCGKAFARRDALRCHRRSHTGERPYRCDVCGQAFTQFSPLTIHKRLHTGERPYVCDMCPKSFVSKSTMMAHKKKHHS